MKNYEAKENVFGGNDNDINTVFNIFKYLP
jgi:hypothetical protein